MPRFRRFRNAERGTIRMAFEMPVASDHLELISVSVELMDLAANAAQFFAKGRFFSVASIE